MGISREQALDCFASDDLIGIGMEADAVRRALHPEGVVSYAIDLPIDLGALYTRSTGADRITQRHANPGSRVGGLEAEGPAGQALAAKIRTALEQGGTGIVLEHAGGLALEGLEQILAAIRCEFPQLRVLGFAAPEIAALARDSQLSVAEVVARLQAAGLDVLSGEGAETLGLELWLAVHRAAHAAGLATIVTMRFGAGETFEERVRFLEAVRALQQDTNGFIALVLASHHAPGGRDLDDATAVEYLKTLAICRMVLDNIPHVQTNWEQQGLKVLQMGLRFGGNDVGSVLGATSRAPEEEVRRLIRDAGFKPVQRDTLYRTHFLN